MIGNCFISTELIAIQERWQIKRGRFHATRAPASHRVANVGNGDRDQKAASNVSLKNSSGESTWKFRLAPGNKSSLCGSGKARQASFSAL
jgi:hypothetical protein